jgi:hypothetical protein
MTYDEQGDIENVNVISNTSSCPRNVFMSKRDFLFKCSLVFATIFVLGCGSQRTGDEVSNETWLASEHPESTKNNSDSRTENNNIQSEPEQDTDDPTPPTTIEEEQPEETVAEEPETEESKPEEEPEPEDEPTSSEPEEEPEDEEINSCFSYLDCPNHEACNTISSTCFLCTEGWHCNNHFDQQQTGPSFCCTQEDIDNQRCDLVGTCQE